MSLSCLQLTAATQQSSKSGTLSGNPENFHITSAGMSLCSDKRPHIPDGTISRIPEVSWAGSELQESQAGRASCPIKPRVPGSPDQVAVWQESLPPPPHLGHNPDACEGRRKRKWPKGEALCRAVEWQRHPGEPRTCICAQARMDSRTGRPEVSPVGVRGGSCRGWPQASGHTVCIPGCHDLPSSGWAGTCHQISPCSGSCFCSVPAAGLGPSLRCQHQLILTLATLWGCGKWHHLAQTLTGLGSPGAEQET